MIRGLGNDIIEVDRIKKNIERYGLRFLDRVFTLREQRYCTSRKEPALHFAGRFAAKEAVVKAFGSGFSDGISWLDIEILNDFKGKPHAVLSTTLLDTFEEPTILVTISHCHAYAIATAIWQ